MRRLSWPWSKSSFFSDFFRCSSNVSAFLWKLYNTCAYFCSVPTVRCLNWLSNAIISLHSRYKNPKLGTILSLCSLCLRTFNRQEKKKSHMNPFNLRDKKTFGSKTVKLLFCLGSCCLSTFLPKEELKKSQNRLSGTPLFHSPSLSRPHMFWMEPLLVNPKKKVSKCASCTQEAPSDVYLLSLSLSLSLSISLSPFWWRREALNQVSFRGKERAFSR